MIEVIFLGLILIVLLVFIYKLNKNQDGFLRYFSRGAYMRGLNKEIKDKINHH